MADGVTYVFDAENLVLGRLASVVAETLLNAARADRDDRVIITNAEKAIVSGSRESVTRHYLHRYRLNHARKGPFFPRMRHPEASRPRHAPISRSPPVDERWNLRVEIGTPSTSSRSPRRHQAGTSASRTDRSRTGS